MFAKLIDNIYTNDIINNTISGLLVNDISDHLPVFIVYDNNYKSIQPVKKVEYKRARTEESIRTFNNDLMRQNWDIIYRDNNNAVHTTNF